MRTDKDRDRRVLEGVVAQLRHAYEQLTRPDAEHWSQRQRIQFADGLIAPQITRLEALMQAADTTPQT